MSHLLWHWASVYNGHLRGPVAITPFAECLAVDLSLPVFTTYVCRVAGSGSFTTCFYCLRLSRLGFEHPTFSLRGERSNTLRRRCGYKLLKTPIIMKLHERLSLTSGFTLKIFERIIRNNEKSLHFHGF